MAAELEEKLREAACFGDIDGVKELLSHGVNVNAQHEINGWTALHWAAKRNHLNIVNLLCNHGADKNIPTNKGEVAAQLTGEGVIKVLLNAMRGGSSGGSAPSNGSSTPAPAAANNKPTVKTEEKKLPITPNYIRNPPLAYQVDIGERKESRSQAKERKQDKRMRIAKHFDSDEEDVGELILKVRASGRDPDYIEIELAKDALTLEYLMVMGCEELGLSAESVDRVRKMPNTRLRRDKEVGRLKDYQEIEFVLKSPPQENGVDSGEDESEQGTNNGSDNNASTTEQMEA
eukprot:TRINITY_DN11512_c0_g1_i1.p1 TRINITY_DN11512_c0_g1~~TRINITY_DN11512_c0_g1_i1.p1  ORF type:complete len:289 (-),score=79.16 TRINITY_DN11512_c0_g1_i1:680-1546(-)